VSPISASSAAAPTAVPTMSAALGGALRASDEGPAPVAGVPRGWAGCCSRGGEGRLARAVRPRGPVAGGLEIAGWGRDEAGFRPADARLAAGLGLASGPGGVPCGAAGRLALRRWGRVRGSADRRSVGSGCLTKFGTGVKRICRSDVKS
jgi:hypothetical protein